MACPSCQLSWHWPRALDLAGLHPLTSDWQCTCRRTLCTHPCDSIRIRKLEPGVHLSSKRMTFQNDCYFVSEVTSLFLSHKPVHIQVPASMQFFFHAIEVFCMALTVTNALGKGKRADIVSYGMTFEALLFFLMNNCSLCMQASSKYLCIFAVCSHCPWHEWQNKNIFSCSAAK